MIILKPLSGNTYLGLVTGALLVSFGGVMFGQFFMIYVALH